MSGCFEAAWKLRRMRKILPILILCAVIILPRTSSALELQPLGYSNLGSSHVSARTEKSPRNSYAKFSAELVKIARQAGKFVAPGKKFAAVGVNFIREQNANYKVNLRGGLSTSLRNPRAGVQLDISW